MGASVLLTPRMEAPKEAPLGHEERLQRDWQPPETTEKKIGETDQPAEAGHLAQVPEPQGGGVVLVLLVLPEAAAAPFWVLA